MRMRCTASAAVAEEAPPQMHEPDSPGLGPAALATLRMLEWPRLCVHVARFASTTLGRQAALELQVRLYNKQTTKCIFASCDCCVMPAPVPRVW